LKNSIGWDQIIEKSILVDKLGVKQLIAGECTLQFIANDINTDDKTRAGYQYWALDNYTGKNNTEYKKGEFRVNTNTGDYFIVDPATGISFKASKIVMDAIGSKLYGNFDIIDSKNSEKKYLSLILVNSDNSLKDSPKIILGYDDKTQIDCKGSLYVDTPDYPSFSSYIKI
jgi:hypothetical protein